MSLNVDSRELIKVLKPRMSFIFSISEENGHNLLAVSVLSMAGDALGHDGPRPGPSNVVTQPGLMDQFCTTPAESLER